MKASPPIKHLSDLFSIKYDSQKRDAYYSRRLSVTTVFICGCLKHQKTCDGLPILKGEKVVITRHSSFTLKDGTRIVHTLRWRVDCFEAFLINQHRKESSEISTERPSKVSPKVNPQSKQYKIIGSYQTRLRKYLKDPNPSLRRKKAIQNCIDKIRGWGGVVPQGAFQTPIKIESEPPEEELTYDKELQFLMDRTDIKYKRDLLDKLNAKYNR